MTFKQIILMTFCYISCANSQDLPIYSMPEHTHSSVSFTANEATLLKQEQHNNPTWTEQQNQYETDDSKAIKIPGKPKPKPKQPCGGNSSCGGNNMPIAPSSNND